MMMTSEIAIVIPLLGRPHRVRPIVDSVRDATPQPHSIWLMCTLTDLAVVEQAQGVPGVHVVLTSAKPQGDYAAKINKAFRLSDEPFIFTGADDLRFEKGWWPAARRHFENELIGVVGTNDLAPNARARAGTHSTHSVIRRSYAEAHGLIDGKPGVLFEGYPHEYVDDELVGTAKKRGAWAYAADSVVEHLHPNWGKGKLDPIYRKQGRRMILGRRVFTQRRRMWM